MSEDKKPETTKKVRIQMLRPGLVERRVNKQGILEGRIVEIGSVVEVSQEEADELCDTQFKGHYSFAGERYGDPKNDPDCQRMHDYRRAKRVA